MVSLASLLFSPNSRFVDFRLILVLWESLFFKKYSIFFLFFKLSHIFLVKSFIIFLPLCQSHLYFVPLKNKIYNSLLILNKVIIRRRSTINQMFLDLRPSLFNTLNFNSQYLISSPKTPHPDCKRRWDGQGQIMRQMCTNGIRYILNMDDQAVKTHAPPMALIFCSAILLKNLALTTTGCLGKNPLPKTLKQPALVTSITGTVSVLAAYIVLDCSVSRFHNLSMLMEGK